MNRLIKILFTIIPLILSFQLTACKGGGGATANPPTNPSPPTNPTPNPIPPEPTPPQPIPTPRAISIQNVSPASGEIGLEQTITVTFDRAITFGDRADIGSNSALDDVRLTSGSYVAPIMVNISGNTVTISPSLPLRTASSFLLTIETEAFKAVDDSGTMSSTFTTGYRTAAGQDQTVVRFTICYDDYHLEEGKVNMFLLHWGPSPRTSRDSNVFQYPQSESINATNPRALYPDEVCVPECSTDPEEPENNLAQCQATNKVAQMFEGAVPRSRFSTGMNYFSATACENQNCSRYTKAEGQRSF